MTPTLPAPTPLEASFAAAIKVTKAMAPAAPTSTTAPTIRALTEAHALMAWTATLVNASMVFLVIAVKTPASQMPTATITLALVLSYQVFPPATAHPAIKACIVNSMTIPVMMTPAKMVAPAMPTVPTTRVIALPALRAITAKMQKAGA